ncbi:MAG: extracellular solute-binding protein, partial [Acetatifactor sp.]|nr:extracellular solute-binding protein [Acetatifactor sp.]
EMIAGKGPDLLGDWTVNISECVIQGYLVPLDEAVEDRSPFLESAFATGEVNGQLYGIPYVCYPYFLTVSPKLKDADSWTLNQMYQAVRNSSVEILEADADGVDIVMACGLHDEDNTAFIDWEKGESHLTEEPFLELMAFAKEYADKGGYPPSEVGERLADGRIAGINIVLSSPEMLHRARACFDGEAACIGYPRETGNGIYMETMRLYLNRNAGNREGAIDFLQYLVSEEGQRQYMEYSYKNWELLPVRRSLLQEVIDRYQQNVKDTPTQHRDSKGIYFVQDKLDEEQVETFWRILDNAVPAVFKADDIWSMVDEELQPYFNDARSAEDAAAALHNRVQLYLDEPK